MFLNNINKLRKIKSPEISLSLLNILITSAICLFFSYIVWNTATAEFERSLRSLERKVSRIGNVRVISLDDLEVLKEIRESRDRFFITLVSVNGVIIILSGIFGYYHVKKMLHPIKLSSRREKQFVANASHELKTPLTAMLTTLEVAKRTGSKDDLLEAVEVSISEVNNLRALVDRLLRLSRGSDIEIIMEEFNCHELFLNLTKRFSENISVKNCKVSNLLETEIILGDKSIILEILSILMENALSAVEFGGEISLKLQKSNSHVDLLIEDNGVGMDEGTLARAFDRLYTKSKSRQRNVGLGFGLGLSIAKELADKIQGELILQSKLGVGTKAILRLKQ